MSGDSPLAALKRLVFGRPKNPLDPHVFHTLTLTALLAWVGLGADGLSSSCYGPEEAYRALGVHHPYALVLALMMALTIFVISASYSQLIELFPGGGGGYLVASKLLGPRWGVLSGSALVIDYCYTIAISIASGVDALFSFLGPAAAPWKLTCALAVVGLMVVLNLRGVKESIRLLLPIFVLFMLTHAVVILWGVLTNLPRLQGLIFELGRQATADVRHLGLLPVVFMVLRAYSLGGGTYTGIEAVSNGLATLAEPRVRTGKQTMVLMAASLAFTAGGILLSYALVGVEAVAGQTMNATLIGRLSADWSLGGVALGRGFLLLALVSEGALLFVAAQAGFVDGPRVLANMAVDSYAPRQLAHLSDRLVVKNGIAAMGVAAALALLVSGGHVGTLVVVYSINVFITFSLSQLGMCRHWLKAREGRWRRALAVNAVGFGLTFTLLVVTCSLKFAAGGWFNLCLLIPLVAASLAIHRHYGTVGRRLAGLDGLAAELAEALPAAPPPPLPGAKGRTAALLVSGYNGLGLHALLSLQRLFPGHFPRVAFISAGVLDSGSFKGAGEAERLARSVEGMLLKYVDAASRLGLSATYAYRVGVDRLSTLEELCRDLHERCPGCVFFAGKLVFPEETRLTRLLHNQTAFELQRRLHYQGMNMMMLPVLSGARARGVQRAPAAGGG